MLKGLGSETRWSN